MHCLALSAWARRPTTKERGKIENEYRQPDKSIEYPGRSLTCPVLLRLHQHSSVNDRTSGCTGTRRLLNDNGANDATEGGCGDQDFGLAMARRYSSGKYCKAPLLYAGAIFAALRRISLTVVSVSRASRFHLCACMKSSEEAGPGIRSRLEQVLAAAPTFGRRVGSALRLVEVLRALCPIASWFSAATWRPVPWLLASFDILTSHLSVSDCEVGFEAPADAED